jgi:hypothetical protein
MITKLEGLGDTTAGGENIGPNSSFWDMLAHPIDSFTYSMQALQSTVAGIGEPDIKSSLPSPIVASQASPVTIIEATSPGGWTPTDAAYQGLLNEQTANSSMLTDYTNSLSNQGINWSSILLIGGLIIGGIIVLPYLVKK